MPGTRRLLAPTIPLALPYFQGKIGFAMGKITIGVLDIQGSVEEHVAMLNKMKAPVRLVKTVEDLNHVQGLIMPGGESTTIGKLLKLYGLDREIRKRVFQKSLTVWGTCAGAILIAKKVSNRKPDNLALMDIDVERNAYGRQLDSFEADLTMPLISKKPVPAVFIRAPKIATLLSPGTKNNTTSAQIPKILAEYKGTAVMVQQGNMLATTFHPELTDSTAVHQYFIDLTTHYAKEK